jgi:hypothetical protein
MLVAEYPKTGRGPFVETFIFALPLGNKFLIQDMCSR